MTRRPDTIHFHYEKAADGEQSGLGKLSNIQIDFEDMQGNDNGTIGFSTSRPVAGMTIWEVVKEGLERMAEADKSTTARLLNSDNE